jgi:hypothetical protein
MSELKPIVCKLADKPKTYRKDGWRMVNGKWVANDPKWNMGEVVSHKSKVFKGKGRYYV